jgi:hypothetical protein
LNAIALTNKRRMLHLLIEAASQTLLEFGERRLGGRIGCTMLLHTWDQTLGPHAHVHCLVPGGALSYDGSRWVPSRPNFLFPVRALGTVYRAKFLTALRERIDKGELRLPGSSATASGGQEFRRVIERLWGKPWVVYAKRPFAGPETMLDYLGRYTHRVAIGNHRITRISDGQVTFRYRDRARGDISRTMTLDAGEFIRRFLLHVLPKGFMRIRHFGFLSNRCKGASLERARTLLGVRRSRDAPAEKATSAAEWVLSVTGIDFTRCPKCGCAPLIREEIHGVAPRARASPRSSPIEGSS